MTRYQTFGDGGDVIGFTEVDGVLPVPGFAFATFDPRIDGLAGDVGSIAAASDCPLVFRKVGTLDTEWIIENRGTAPALFAVMSAAEMNAMCRGFARQPLLDFAPTHILTPDPVSDSFVDSVGTSDLKKRGVGASIDSSPFFDGVSTAGQQALQTDLQQSFYGADDETHYDVTTQSFVVLAVAAFAKNGTGGLYLSKIKYPAPAQDRGYGVSINLDNGFGFLLRGSLTELNSDSSQFTANVVDGRYRAFFHGRTVPGALGYVFTPEFPSVGVAGLAGDLHSTDSIFGLLNDGFALPRAASSTSRTPKIVFWEGTAAENLTTYLAVIGAAFQEMLGDAPSELQVVSQRYDLPANDTQFAQRTGLLASWYRPDWINAAGNVASQGVAATIVAAGATAQYQKLSAGLVGMAFPGATGDAVSANVLANGVDSFIAGGRFGHTANAGGLNSHNLLGRIVAGATATGWSIFVADNGDLKYYVADGVLSFSATLQAAVLPLNARELDVVMQLDRSGADPTARFLWARDGVQLGTATVVMAGLGSLTLAGQEFGSGAIPIGAPAFNGGAWSNFFFCALGTQAAGSGLVERVARGCGFLTVTVNAAQAVIG